MSVTVENRRNRLRSAVAAVLTALLLVPVSILFVMVWSSTADDRDQTQRERQGVEYLTQLGPLVTILAEGQSSALAGVSAAPAAMEGAVNNIAAVDSKLGADLGTRERWAGLRDKIDELPAVTGGALAVYQAHVEAADLLLALFNTVRDNSGLARDQDNDLSHLQAAIADDLPNTVTQATRMADLALMVAGASAAQQRQLGPEYGAAVKAVESNVNQLTDNLQAAVDDTNSSTLSSSLISTLDTFRSGIETLTRGADPTGGKPDPSALATARSKMTQTLAGINTTILKEMDGLLADRLDDLDSDRLQLIVTAVAAVLLAAAAIAVPRFGRFRGAAARSGSRAASGSAGVPDNGLGNSPNDQLPSFGNQVSPTRRERSGVLR